MWRDSLLIWKVQTAREQPSNAGLQPPERQTEADIKCSGRGNARALEGNGGELMDGEK